MTQVLRFALLFVVDQVIGVLKHHTNNYGDTSLTNCTQRAWYMTFWSDSYSLTKLLKTFWHMHIMWLSGNYHVKCVGGYFIIYVHPMHRPLAGNTSMPYFGIVRVALLVCIYFVNHGTDYSFIRSDVIMSQSNAGCSGEIASWSAWCTNVTSCFLAIFDGHIKKWDSSFKA